MLSGWFLVCYVYRRNRYDNQHTNGSHLVTSIQEIVSFCRRCYLTVNKSVSIFNYLTDMKDLNINYKSKNIYLFFLEKVSTLMTTEHGRYQSK